MVSRSPILAVSSRHVCNGGARLVAKQFEDECVGFFAEAVQIVGVPKSVGQIYGVLYASPEPLSFSDIVERLQISKGSASQGLQLLRSLGAINEARGGDVERRGYFEPELSLRRLVRGVLRERIAPMTVTGAERLIRLRALAASGHGGPFYLNRAQQLNTWRRRLKMVLPVLAALLGPKDG